MRYSIAVLQLAVSLYLLSWFHFEDPSKTGIIFAAILPSINPLGRLKKLLRNDQNAGEGITGNGNVSFEGVAIKDQLKDNHSDRQHSNRARLNSNDLLKLLSRFDNTLFGLTDKTAIAKTIFHSLIEILDSHQVTLFQGDSVLDSVSPVSDSLLESPQFDPARTEGIFPLTKEIFIPIGADTKVAGNKFMDNGAQALLVKLEGLEEFVFRLDRPKGAPLFKAGELEPLFSLVHRYKLAQRYIREYRCELPTIRSIFRFDQLLSDIVYVKSENGFCRVFCHSGVIKSGDVKRVGNLDSLKLGLPMMTIKVHFPSDILLRIHRSYFINPDKIVRIIRKTKSSPDFKVFLDIGDSTFVTLPVGRNFIQEMRELFPSQFEGRLG